jgi:hypothetical protein
VIFLDHGHALVPGPFSESVLELYLTKFEILSLDKKMIDPGEDVIKMDVDSKTW